MGLGVGDGDINSLMYPACPHCHRKFSGCHSVTTMVRWGGNGPGTDSGWYRLSSTYGHAGEFHRPKNIRIPSLSITLFCSLIFLTLHTHTQQQVWPSQSPPPEILVAVKVPTASTPLQNPKIENKNHDSNCHPLMQHSPYLLSTQTSAPSTDPHTVRSLRERPLCYSFLNPQHVD